MRMDFDEKGRKLLTWSTVHIEASKRQRGVGVGGVGVGGSFLKVQCEMVASGAIEKYTKHLWNYMSLYVHLP